MQICLRGILEKGLAKLLQDLAKWKVITSAKGPNGGFYLTEKNKNAALINVVEKIDGLDKFDSCVLGLSECNPNNPCPIHFSIAPFKDKLLADLKNNSIKDYAIKVQNGESFLTEG
jgi:DNA-binding IscR family transcriptional regulator